MNSQFPNYLHLTENWSNYIRCRPIIPYPHVLKFSWSLFNHTTYSRSPLPPFLQQHPSTPPVFQLTRLLPTFRYFSNRIYNMDDNCASSPSSKFNLKFNTSGMALLAKFEVKEKSLLVKTKIKQPNERSHPQWN